MNHTHNHVFSSTSFFAPVRKDKRTVKTKKAVLDAVPLYLVSPSGYLPFFFMLTLLCFSMCVRVGVYAGIHLPLHVVCVWLLQIFLVKVAFDESLEFDVFLFDKAVHHDFGQFTATP